MRGTWLPAQWNAPQFRQVILAQLSHVSCCASLMIKMQMQIKSGQQGQNCGPHSARLHRLFPTSGRRTGGISKRVMSKSCLQSAGSTAGSCSEALYCLARARVLGANKARCTACSCWPSLSSSVSSRLSCGKNVEDCREDVSAAEAGPYSTC